MNALPFPRRVASLAVAATLTFSLVACNEDEPEPTGSTPHATSVSPSPTSAPEASPTPSTPTEDEETTGTEETAVAVYFAGDTPAGTRLFREFRNVSGDALTEAALLVDGGSANDPDYRTLWPGMTIDSVTADDSLITVTLQGDAFTEAPDGMAPEEAALAVQQLVYTLQAAAGDRLPVEFVRTSGPSTLFGIDVSTPVEAFGQLDVLAGVNLTTPAQGATVSGGELALSGVANAVEANVLWRIESAGETVLEGNVTADGSMDKLHPFEGSIDVSSLEPGEYTLVVADSEDMGEGFGPTEDTRTFTIG